MAVKTHLKSNWRLKFPDDAWLSYGAQYLPEAASQTFIKGAPLIDTGSAGVVGAAGTGPISAAILCFALEAGHNGTAAQYVVKVLPAYQGLHVEANFLGAAAIDNELAQTDLFASFDADYTADIDGNSTPGFYIEDAASNAAVKMVSFEAQPLVPNAADAKSIVGDTNARCTFAWLAAKTAWDR